MRSMLLAALLLLSGLAGTAAAAYFPCPAPLSGSQAGCTITSVGGTTTYTVATSAQALRIDKTKAASVAVSLTADNLPCGDGVFFASIPKTDTTTLAFNANGSCTFDVTPAHPVQLIAVSFTDNATPSHISLTANPTAFVPDFLLNVNVSGYGSVASADGSIACGQNCSASFAPNSTVTLTATPDPGYMFIGWGGDCFILTPTCTVTMSGAKNTTAFFAVADSSLVVEYYHAASDRYFITSDPNEAASIDAGGAGPGWARTGQTFHAGGGPVPVCRFYGSLAPGPNSHFYTAVADECNALRQLQAATPDSQPRWNYEGTAFSTTLPVNGACPAGTVPVYRAYNNGFLTGKDSNHRITASAQAIQDVLDRGWKFEGVVMCAPR